MINTGKANNIKGIPQTAGKGSKLGTRIVTGLSLAGLTVFLTIWSAGAIAVEVLILSIIGVIEFYRMAERKKMRPSVFTGICGVVLLVYFAYTGLEPHLSPLIAGLITISMLGFIFRKGFHVSSFLDVSVTVLGFLYCGWFLSYVVFIRKIPGPIHNLWGISIEHGAGLVLMLLFSTHLTDTGAFFVGKYFGRHKLAPRISPNKTVEGSLGGMLGAMAGAVLVGSFLGMHMEHIITIGILCGIFAQLGDLWASILKRDVNVKDAGSVFAGHGGVLDRIDSLLFTAPIAFYFFKYFL